MNTMVEWYDSFQAVYARRLPVVRYRLRKHVKMQGCKTMAEWFDDLNEFLPHWEPESVYFIRAHKYDSMANWWDAEIVDYDYETGKVIGCYQR